MDLLKDYQKLEALASAVTRNVDKMEEKCGNLYEAITIVAKRSNQVGTQLKQELDAKLQEFASVTDSLEEIFENREQIEISKMYERLPKPSALALEEFLEDKVYFRRQEETEEEESEEA
ncbi:MAG: DNA-directed RNA polymerase subunit omega [Flavobacteriales bacterium]|jgi:DNA-directed RNA polymerase subunit K/omega|nr:DNA-directed RNA polymerase subunit omega [Flavobacteriales bacterium]MBT6133279.1 DNA-directed RNA polymerase subunit omega [Flavobacteriales bacterium]MBT6916460.1 DNA-directed RNA polymerase subunit omega [Flavobacteriales bacterium]MBT7750489.1 DNA-directed RNA polymerase subunit omega [Flavobacteriales bacterium]